MAAEDYQAHVEGEPLPGRPNPRFPDQVPATEAGVNIGRGIEDAGNFLTRMDVSNQAKALQAQQKVQAQAQQTQLTDANNQIQAMSLNLTHNPQTGAFTKQGKDAFNLGDQYLPQFDQAGQAIVDSVPDPKARQAASMALEHARNQFSEQLDTHELSQHQKFAVQTTQASIKLAQQQAAANYNHPDILGTARDTLMVSLQNLGKQQGWSDDELKEQSQSALSGMHTDVIDRMLTDGKFQMAKHYLDVVKSDMDPHSAWAADRTIDAQIKEKQNEQKQDIADRYQDSLEAAQRGLKNPITVTRQEMGVLFDKSPERAQRRWDELQIYQQAGAQAKEYDHMSAAEIAADVKNSAPQEGGPEALFQIKAQEIKARAAQQSIEKRQADPAQFVQDRGGWPPLDPRNPQAMMDNLVSRARTQGEVSQQIGMPVPLLSKPEAKGLSQVLSQGSPAEQVDLLTSLRSSMPTDAAYNSVLNQVSPNSPVVSVVGQMVDRPHSPDQPGWYDPKFSGDPLTGQRILRGEQILSGKGEQKAGTESDSTGTSKSGFALPPDTSLQTAFQKALGGNASDLFRGRANTAEIYYKAFKDYYAAAAEAAGNTSGKMDDGLAKQAAQAVIGHVTEYGPSNLMVPHGMDPTQFEGHMDAAIDQALTDAGYSDAQKSLFKGMPLRELGTTLGTGRYVIQNTQGLPLKSPDGKDTVIVDLHAHHNVKDASWHIESGVGENLD